ncbi:MULTISPECIES: 5-bromo-4-chloroindolyl phosphate hydrolysis family protein [Bacillus]|uniref:5-bromo-4-chloroindolyl phosphate hydrolysis family protein n=1 Tax=Bacillus TaxID=1386 RepID=UPI000BB6F806|nr:MULTISPECIES: 5-bromo-4-chloroindolyl phosphate hydrolysis family protein [Bacillus]
MQRAIRKAASFIIAFNIAFIFLIITTLSTEITFMFSSILSVLLFTGTFLLIKRKLLPNDELEKIARKEKKYILLQAKNAKANVKKISSARFKVRSIFVFQSINKIYRMSSRVIKMVEKEPLKYKNAQNFMKNQLETATIITENYVNLISHPVRNHEISSSIRESEQALKDLERSMETELLNIVSGDVTNLKTELTLLKQTKSLDLINKDMLKK